MGLAIVLIVLVVLFLVSVFLWRSGGNTALGGSGGIGVILSIVLSIGALAWSSFYTLDGGQVGVQKIFGLQIVQTDGSALGEGAGFKNPFNAVVPMTTRQRNIDLHSTADGEGDNKVLDMNSLSLRVDATLPYSLNPMYAGRTYHAFGGDNEYGSLLMQPNASAALRKAAGLFSVLEANGDKREQFANQVKTDFVGGLVSQLSLRPEFSDLSPEQLSTVFLVGEPLLKEVAPHEKVVNAIAEKAAAEQYKQRQQILNEMELSKVSQVKALGQQLEVILSSVNGNASDASRLLDSWSHLVQSQAAQKAVDDQVPVTFFFGGNVAPSVPSK
jgi:regulator of protease activity HflC (stomatin/prohibitin superfamily)